jgi:hypothetical protein
VALTFNGLHGTERERRKKWGSSERDYILGGVGKKEIIFPVLKVPRQCPFVLVEAALPKRVQLYGVIPQKTEFLVTTAERTPKPTTKLLDLLHNIV